ncbi:hypothetical protein PVK06_000436 [Gossypium arboreum]|uniref:Reverse transcriptase domain-containing protein n=1 Tax=Gossypium arboreum TaxID=29729 RepID=A0ABR0QYB3_GOSAR|nr:hypothetical protein PVK06_000436 [Gossypium arboreum]
MVKLTKPNQASFVARRNITVNIIVAQETIHSMKGFKGGKYGMTLKINLEKASDKVRWDFLEDTLLEAGLPCLLVSVILNCVSSASLQVLWNGDVTEAFRPSCRIRQGDPLSLDLIIPCIEKLGHLIEETLNRGSWSPIFLSRRGPALTILSFSMKPIGIK